MGCKKDPDDVRIKLFNILQEFNTLDLRHELVSLKGEGNILEMVISRGKPLEFAAAITGLLPEELAEARIEKLEVIFR